MKFVDRITAHLRLRLLDSTIRTAAPDSHVLRATALGDKARTLYGIGKRDEAAAVCDVILETYASHEDQALLPAVAEALYIKGVCIGDSGDLKASLEVYRELRSRCAGAKDLPVRVHVAQGWFNEAGTLAELGRTADAIAAFSGLIAHFGGDEDPEVQEQVAMALVNLGKQFGDAGRRDDELAAYATVIERFGDNTAPYARKQVAMALHNRLHVLGLFGRMDDWEITNAEFQRRFARDRDPAIRVLSPPRVRTRDNRAQDGQTDAL